MTQKLLLNYDFLKKVSNTSYHDIGATISETLRTITTHNDTNCKYVKKFGTDYAIDDITNGVITTPRSDGGGVNKWWYEIYNENGTLLATIKDENATSTFVDGTAETSERVYIKIVWKSGTVGITDGDTIALTTDVDAPLTVYISGESFTSGELLLALSSSGSTYYMDSIADNSMIHGGFRCTPTGTAKYPYYDINSAIASLTGAFTIVTVLDSESYDEEIDLNVNGMTLQAELGQTPRICPGKGNRATREVSIQGNNSNTAYVSKNGSNSNPGTYQLPYLTIVYAETNLGSRTNINIMDSEVYEENITINNATTIEPIYGKTPKLVVLDTGANGLKIYNNCSVFGLEVDCDKLDKTIGRGIAILGTSYNGEISNNYTYNGGSSSGIGQNIATGHFISFVCKNNIVKDSTGVGILGFSSRTSGAVESILIKGNILLNCSTGIFSYSQITGSTVTIEDNVVYNSNYCYNLGNKGTTNIVNNTAYLSVNAGIQTNFATGTMNFKNNIAYGSSGTDIIDTGTGVPTVNYSNYGTISGFTIGTGNITTDPEIFDATDENLSLKPTSGAKNTADDIGDMGARFNVIKINEADIKINGFIIDGQNYYFKGISFADNSGYTGNSIKWCTIKNCKNSGIESYNGNSGDTLEVLYCWLRENEIGANFLYGQNLLKYSIIMSSLYVGVFLKNGIQQVINNAIYSNYYGVYIKSLGSTSEIKNSIIYENSFYGIYSDSPFVLTYCSISDDVFKVDISDETNVSGNPLFINEELYSEDLNIKTTETNVYNSEGENIGFYTIDSPCKNKGSDGYDIGAYKVDRVVTEKSSKSFVFYNNPFKMDDSINAIGFRKTTNSKGGSYYLGNAHKRIFPLEWQRNDDQTEEQLKKIQYISTLIKTDENGLIEDEVLIRLHLQKDTYLLTGTGSTIDATAKTISDINLDLIPNEFKGFHIGVKYETGTGLVINATTKTGTDAGASWTVDEWKGFYIYHNNNYYYILSNTSTALTLSDPYDTLVNSTINYSIEKYFKILSNSKNQFLISDRENNLVSGTYDYYIDFIECKVANNQFQAIQDTGFRWEKFQNKTGFNLLLEEA